ncbi:MAG: type II toxin-antitoxin system PemK/MazF family toxin [Thaumarchaeota archaeon]|nr:type II toxin-antitoxin system PemK/MazF family toxin [Nitrososphaerota archaeon]
MTFRFNIKAGDVILAKPNYQDQVDNYVRPVLVISKSNFHQDSGFFVCAGITTNQTSDKYLIPITSQDTSPRLKEQSQVMCKRIVTIREDAIIKKVCSVTPDFYNRVKAIILTDVLDF